MCKILVCLVLRIGIRTSELLLALTLFFTASVQADMTFKGNLLDRPCQLDPASEIQSVEFLDVATPTFLHPPGKSYAKTFTIKLVNCYASTLNKVVSLILQGQAEPELPGYLAVAGVNSGKLAIGIIDTDGISLLKLGTVHNRGAGERVTGSSVTMNFKAYVQVTPAALTQKSVQPGDYSATANFELSYQ